jgi:polysaccharide biosynthesis transport protein
MSLTQFILILRARWWIILLVLVLVGGSVIAVSMVLPKQYTATASVVLDNKPDPVSLAFGGGISPAYIATQMDIINSERVARRVVRSLRLTDNEATRQRWREATDGGKGDMEGWVADSLQRGLQVRPSRESTVINIGYEGADPRFAALVANAFVQAYVDTTLELRVDPAKQYSSFFEERSRKLREELEAAQTRLSAFQKSKGIINTEERVDVETARLNELSAQVVGLQGLTADSTSRQAQARTAGDQLENVINNGLITSLKAELSRNEARLQEMSTRLGDAHPQVAETKAVIAELRGKIETEIRRVTSSVTVTNNINRGREAQIRAELEAQRAKVLRMKETRDELLVMQRDVDNAQRAYDGVLNRLNQTTMESATTQTNVVVLAQAVEPSRPSSPRIVLNGILGIFFGLLLGVGAALAVEMARRRVRSDEDIVQGLGLPVLGEMLAPQSKRLFGRGRPPAMLKHVIGQLPAPNARGA